MAAAGRVADAEVVLQAGLADGHGEVSDWLRLVRLRFSSGRPDMALEAAVNGIERYPRALDLSAALCEVIRACRDTPYFSPLIERGRSLLRDVFLRASDRQPIYDCLLMLCKEPIVGWRASGSQPADVLGAQHRSLVLGPHAALGEGLRIFREIKPITVSDAVAIGSAKWCWEENGEIEHLDFPRRLSRESMQVPMPNFNIAEILDAHVFGSRTTVVKDGSLINVNATLWTRVSPVEHTYLLGAEGGRQFIDIPKASRRLTGSVILLSTTSNHYHLTVDFLSAVLRSVQSPGLPPETRFLLSGAAARHREALAAVLNVDSERVIIINDHETFEVERLLVVGGRTVTIGQVAGGGLEYTVICCPKADLGRLRNRVRILTGGVSVGPELIFASRKDAARLLRNEDELRSMLESEGFFTIVQSELGLMEQLVAVANARIVLGEHGANLTNALYMKPDGAVVEILTPGNYFLANCYSEIAAAASERYREVYAVNNVVNVDELRSLIRTLKAELGLSV